VTSHPVCDNLVIDVIMNDPKLAPCKVKLALPVPAKFARLDALIIGVSTLNRLVIVAMSPMVRETLALAMTAVEAWHCSAESDCHRVISQIVTDKRAMPEYRITPKFCPTSVRVSDPVVGLFPVTFSARSRANATMLARSVVTARVRVPVRAPAVKVTLCCDILSESPTLHMIIVSDVHSVASNAVNPRRPFKEDAYCPKPLPYAVMVVPTAGTFVIPICLVAIDVYVVSLDHSRQGVLRGGSKLAQDSELLELLELLELPECSNMKSAAILGALIENDSVMVPAAMPVVTEVRGIRPKDACAIARREVWLNHSVDSLPVWPILVADDNHPTPSCDPRIVTETEPVDGLFCCQYELMLLRSVEYASVMLPIWSCPAVIATRRNSRDEAAVLQTTEESEIQVLLSVVVNITRVPVV
jgi:hypothetical protein